MIDHAVGVQHHFIAQHTIVLHHRAGKNAAAFAEHSMAADIHMCADFATSRHARGGFNHGSGVHAGHGLLPRRKQARHFGEIKIRVVGHNQVAAGEFGRQLRADNQRACAALGHFGFIFWVG